MDSLLDSKTLVTTKRAKFPLQTATCAAFTSLGVFALFWIYLVWARDGFTTLCSPPPIEKAVVVLAGPSNVTGTINFFQARGRGVVTIRGEVHNLDSDALRGFHVHQTGDLTNGCLSAGSHYNPFGKTHGAPTDRNRHVGDLGNIKSDNSGVARFTMEDRRITLNGPLSILGRSIVVHAGTDDLGKGDNEESLKTGNAGARAACGIIGISG